MEAGHRGRDRGPRAAETLDRGDRVLLAGVHDAVTLEGVDDLTEVLDRDVLTCPLDDLKTTQVYGTWLDGKPIWAAEMSK